jgi:hypothetical protein
MGRAIAPQEQVLLPVYALTALAVAIHRTPGT